MIIGINEKYEIKQINEITDDSLTILEIDRELILSCNRIKTNSKFGIKS